MKLRNKKTGEIGNFCYGYTNELCVSWQKDDGFWAKQEYTSLAELNEEWEDAPEEPKRTWFIDTNCTPNYIDYGDNPITDHCYDDWNELGICFETKEEAEKAVKKLKAWKRLKDNGFRLNHWKEAQLRPNMSCVSITGNMKVDEEAKSDLDLLFGGEE